MKKSKTTKKKTAKTRKPPKAAVATAPAESKQKPPRQDLCVFAFRLTEAERDAIHKAAGPAKASKFARTLLVAAARNDEAAVKAIMKAAQTAGVAAAVSRSRRPLGIPEGSSAFMSIASAALAVALPCRLHPVQPTRGQAPQDGSRNSRRRRALSAPNPRLPRRRLRRSSSGTG